MLTQSGIDDYRRNGYTVQSALLSVDDVAALLAELDVQARQVAVPVRLGLGGGAEPLAQQHVGKARGEEALRRRGSIRRP